MDATALILSTHDRSHRLHYDILIQRALAVPDNHRVLVLPMSMGPRDGDERPHQEEEAEKWGRYLRHFADRGVGFVPFFWTEGLRAEDVELLWGFLESSAVVILGGGSSGRGLWRYKELGRRFSNDPDRLGRILAQRQERGLLTVGFSAGADQIMDRLFRWTTGTHDDTEGFGLVRGTLATLHHDPSRNGELQHAARVVPSFRAFGLPNDSGLLVSRGKTPGGLSWQLTRFIIDNSWDRPEDAWHVRTRQGAIIDHFYADGRHWGFNDGDWMLRVWSDDERAGTWIGSAGRILGYESQAPAKEGSIAAILERR